MAVMKRGLIVGGAALAGLLALVGIASAASDDEPSGGGGGPPPPSGPTPDECAAALAEQQIAQQMVQQWKGAIVDLDAALIEAYMNENDEAAAYLEQQKANAIAQRNQWQAKVNQLSAFRQDCP